MDIEEKYKAFYNVVLEEAKVQKDKILQETHAEFTRLSTQYENSLIEKNNKQIKHEKEQLERKSSQRIITFNKDARRQLIDKRETLTNKVFLGVSSQLEAFTQSPEYLDSLVESCNEAKALLSCEEIIVYLNEQDYEKRATLEAISGVQVKRQEENAIGGLIASNLEGNMILDKTFNARLDEAKKSFAGFRISE